MFHWIARLAPLGFLVGAFARGQAPNVPDFDSSDASTRHPRVFFSAAEIERARGVTDVRLEAARQRLLVEADHAFKLEIKPIDEGWWKSASTRPWNETYPEVFQNTWIIPGASATPAEALATAYLLTGEAGYARKAIALLMNLAPYSFQAEHYDVGMNYSVWGVSALRAYDVVLPLMSAEQRQAMDACMTRLARAVLKNDVYWIEHDIGGGINNHLAWHKAMLGLLGLFYDRPPLVEYAMTGPRGIVPLLEDGLVDHGLWCESSLNYQFAAVAPMMYLADAQKRLGHRPALHEITGADGRSLKQACDAMFDVLAPDGMIPPIGDAYGRRQRLFANPLYETALSLWGDSRYAWLMNRNARWSNRSVFGPVPRGDASAPPIRSVILPEHGYVFLRSHADDEYWDNDRALCAFLTYDRSGVHANADKLSLSLFGNRRMLLADVEGVATVPHAFSSRIQGELNRGALAQNTVMIDGRDQRCSPRMLRLTEYRDLPDEKRATAADEEGILYDGVRQMRTVAMTAQYVLDVFQVRCDAERQIDWVMHVLDEKAFPAGEGKEIADKSMPFTVPNTGAWVWLRDVRTWKPEGDFRLEWRDSESRVRMIMLDGAFDRVILCGFPSTDRPDSESSPMVLVRRTGDHATFAAIWLIGDAPKNATLRQLSQHGGKLVFEVDTGNASRIHHVPLLR